MQIQFYFGPDKVPFSLVGGYKPVSDSGEVPFHGIISRGVLSACHSQQLSIESWIKCAPLLECDEPPDTALTVHYDEILSIAKQECALQYGQSAYAVQCYLELHTDDMNVAYECWNIKEGHTSSVWKVSQLNNQNQPQNTFVINVARDAQANLELEQISQKLRLIGQQAPELNLAKVLDIQTVEDSNLPPVTVTKNEWVEASYELHSRKSRTGGQDEYLMVERFLTAPDQPANITSVLGRVLDHNESMLVRQQVDHFLTKAAALLPIPPEININDGDIVWCPTKQSAIVIAIS